MDKVTDILVFISKGTVDCDYNQEIKRHLIFGWTAMTNPDSILRSRDITLPTKVHIVKTTVFPVVMCRCKSWTIETPECQRSDAFQTEVLEKTLESPLDCKEIKPVNPKRNQP